MFLKISLLFFFLNCFYFNYFHLLAFLSPFFTLKLDIIFIYFLQFEMINFQEYKLFMSTTYSFAFFINKVFRAMKLTMTI